MKINIEESSPEALRFTLSGITAEFANAVRRIGMTGVPCFAIDTVTFYDNTSAIFDEYIAHRIGLIPISTPLKGYDEKDQIIFSLQADGPGIVYSGDLKSSDKAVKVANDKIPIIKLADNQSIRIEGKAVMGIGSTSAKFQPGLVTYKAVNIKPNADSDSYDFYVESFGQMPALEILKKAIDIINKSLKEVNAQIGK